jgi:hypothetical protein
VLSPDQAWDFDRRRADGVRGPYYRAHQTLNEVLGCTCVADAKHSNGGDGYQRHGCPAHGQPCRHMLDRGIPAGLLERVLRALADDPEAQDAARAILAPRNVHQERTPETHGGD